MTQFDRAYYERFYENPRTRVTDRAASKRLGSFVFAYLDYLQLPIATVLDLGCGVGAWHALVSEQRPQASYRGVEYSDYLCERFGWERGSVVDFRSKSRFDLVICQGVLPYLDARSAKRAIENLASLSRGALYLEAVTRDDWEGGVIDKRRTDRTMKLRSAAWYRRALAPRFHCLGGGLWLARRAKVAVYALEHA